jgi:hypothetical protein
LRQESNCRRAPDFSEEEEREDFIVSRVTCVKRGSSASTGLRAYMISRQVNKNEEG